MHWRLKEPVHQQAWYWHPKPEYSVSSIRRVNCCKPKKPLTSEFLRYIKIKVRPQQGHMFNQSLQKKSQMKKGTKILSHYVTKGHFKIKMFSYKYRKYYCLSSYKVNLIYLGQAKSKIQFKMWICISFLIFKAIQHVWCLEVTLWLDCPEIWQESCQLCCPGSSQISGEMIDFIINLVNLRFHEIDQEYVLSFSV